MAAPLFVLQDNEFACGAVSIRNAFASMGYDYDLDHIAKLAKTSPTHGTYEKDALRACLRLGHPCKEISYNSLAYSLAELRGAVMFGGAAILAVDRDRHWLAAVGLNGDRVLVHDPAAGAGALSVEELDARWSRRKQPYYFGIVILPRGVE